ncbi:MAG: hypothetical protein Q9214_002041 [Letrouitia sp. 1 TL-2023]
MAFPRRSLDFWSFDVSLAQDHITYRQIWHLKAKRSGGGPRWPVRFVREERAPNPRLSHLEEENQALRNRLVNTGASSSFGPLSASQPATPRPSKSDSSGLSFISERSATAKSGDKSSKSRSLSIASENESSNSNDWVYQGLTSASVLSDTSASHPPSPAQSVDFSIPYDDIRRELEKEAAYQRRLEGTNFYSHSLDFDGVDPNLAMHLLSVHFNRQHHSFLVSYRPLFMRDMAHGGPYFSKLLLNAIYFGASKFSPRIDVRSDPDDPRSAGSIFRHRTKELLMPALERSDITTVQALLILTNSLFAMGQEKSTAWMYAGIAVRMIIDLVVDKIQALYQGRPTSLQAATCQVPLQFLDQYEEEEHWQPVGFSGSVHYPEHPTYSVSTFTSLCKLCRIIEQTLNKIYAVQNLKRGPDGLLGDVGKLHEELGQWALYHVLRIQLHHPFVAKGHLYSAAPNAARDSFKVCTVAATEIVQILMAYDRTFSMAKAPYLIAYSTYVAATIHVRIAANKESGSDAYVNLQRCLAVLSENQVTNSGVSSAIIALQSLSSSLGVNVEMNRDSAPEKKEGRGGLTHQEFSGMNAKTKSHLPPTSFHPNPTLPCPSSDTDLQPVPDFDIDMILQGFAGADMNMLPPGSRYGPVHFDYYPDINPSHDALMLDPNTTEAHFAGFGDQLAHFSASMAPNQSPDHYSL